MGAIIPSTRLGVLPSIIDHLGRQTNTWQHICLKLQLIKEKANVYVKLYIYSRRKRRKRRKMSSHESKHADQPNYIVFLGFIFSTPKLTSK